MANRTIFREEIARRIASAALSVALAFSGLGVLGGCQQEEPEVPTQPGSSGLEAEDRPATGETTQEMRLFARMEQLTFIERKLAELGLM